MQQKKKKENSKVLSNSSCPPVVEITSIDPEGSFNPEDIPLVFPMTNQIGHSAQSNKIGKKRDSPVLTRQCRNSHAQGPLVPMILLLRSPR